MEYTPNTLQCFRSTVIKAVRFNMWTLCNGLLSHQGITVYTIMWLHL